MDHAEVRERLQAALIGGERAGTGTGAREDRLIREHLAGCAACAAERDALLATATALAVAAPDPIRPRAQVRDEVLAAVRTVGIARVPRSARPVASPRGGVIAGMFRVPLRLAWFGAAVATAVAIAVVGVVALAPPPIEQQIAAYLADMTVTTSELMAEPGHRQVELRDPEGRSAGVVLLGPESGRYVVMTGAMPEAQNGQYGCYLDRDGEQTFLGPMLVHGGAAYWAGTMEGAADLGRAGDRLLVMELTTGAEPELIAEF